MNEVKEALELVFDKQIQSVNEIDAEGVNVIFVDGTNNLTNYRQLMILLASKVVELY
jgi:hypothetical protein